MFKIKKKTFLRAVKTILRADNGRLYITSTNEKNVIFFPFTNYL